MSFAEQNLIPLGSLGAAPPREARPGRLPAHWWTASGGSTTSMRISVTDRCNFRCVYCMPEEVQFYPRDHC